MSAGVLSAPRFEVQREPGMCLGPAGTLTRIAASATARIDERKQQITTVVCGTFV